MAEPALVAGCTLSFLTTPCSLQNLSSPPTQGLNLGHCSESAEY